MIDSKGDMRPEGMFNRVRLALEARRACDYPKECPRLPAEKEHP